MFARLSLISLCLALVCVGFQLNAEAQDGDLASRLEGTYLAPEGETNWKITMAGGEGTWELTGRRAGTAKLTYDLSTAKDGRVPIQLKDESGEIGKLFIEALDSGELLVLNPKFKAVVVCSKKDAPVAQPNAAKRKAFMKSMAGDWLTRDGESLRIGKDGKVKGNLAGAFEMVGISNQAPIAYLKHTSASGDQNFYMATVTEGNTSLSVERVGGEGSEGRYVQAFRSTPSEDVDAKALQALQALVTRLPKMCKVYDSKDVKLSVTLGDGTFEVKGDRGDGKGSFTPLAGEGDLLYVHFQSESGRNTGVARLALLDNGSLDAELPSFGFRLCVPATPVSQTDATKAKRKAFMAFIEGEWSSYRPRRPGTVSITGDRMTYVTKETKRVGTLSINAAGPGVVYGTVADADLGKSFPVRITYQEETGLLEFSDLDEYDDAGDGSFFDRGIRARKVK